MMLDYQKQKQLEQGAAPPRVYQLATVEGVFPDGVTLRFDGESVARQKHYPCNAAVGWAAGQRARVEKLGGTYVAAYPIRGKTV